MTRSDHAGVPRAPVDDLPIDPDIEATEDPPHHRRAPQPRARARLSPGILAAVFAGGCAGGYARYALSAAWTTGRYGFPWSTFTVNVAGAFVLALVVVVASDIRRSRYLRPLLGTGFCGALTTMSSLVITTDRYVAHHHPGTASAYLAATTVAALAAATLGLGAGRAAARIPAGRRAVR